jgi:hypothetical protein
MKSIFTTLILLSLLTLGSMSCKEKGCTEATALNFNADAKTDDGSCNSNYDGLWTAKDTLRVTTSSGTSVTVKTYAFSIGRKNAKEIFIRGFNECTRDSVKCAIEGKNFALLNTTECDAVGLRGTLENGVLTYTYKPQIQIGGSIFQYSGKATK